MVESVQKRSTPSSGPSTVRPLPPTHLGRPFRSRALIWPPSRPRCPIRSRSCRARSTTRWRHWRRVTFVNNAGDVFLRRSTTRLLDLVNSELVACDPKSDARLQAALSINLNADGVARGSVIEINGPLPVEKSMLTLSPLPLDDFWVAYGGLGPTRRSFMILIEDWGIPTLANRRGLTPAETRLGQAIIVGKGLAWAACELGISRSTAQSHLDKVFQKTETNRQAELVAFVGNQAIQ
jgi:DNA-binding CsgD family transcriptional regulator